MLNQEVARLTGKLIFNVQGLQTLANFQKRLQSAQTKVNGLAMAVSKLHTALAKTLKIKVDASQVDKSKAKLESAIKRQAQAEAALSNQRRKTFAAEITQSKLRYAGTKAQAQLNTAALASQKQGALVAAKAAASTTAGGVATKSQLASQNAITASVARQTRLQAIQQKLAANTQRAANAHLASQGKLQRIQQQINHGQQQAHLRAQRAAAQQAAAQQTAANKSQNSQQSAGRYQMAQQRHAAWQARQNAPRPTPGGGIGGSGIGGVLALGGMIGGIGIAVSALNGLIGKLGERIEARKESVKDAETFNANFTAISRDPKQQEMWRKNFIDASNESGSAIDDESAKQFRNFVMAQQAYGKKPDDIMKGYKLRQQAFAIGGASKDDAKELNKQLGQMSSDGTGSKQDYDIINDRLPMMAPYLARAYGEENGIKDPLKARQKFNKDLKAGKGVKYDWYEKAMGYMVAENQGMLDDRKKTVTFAQTKADNQKFLADNSVNTDANLSDAMKDNIKAHQELNEELATSRSLLKSFDEGLTKAETGLLRFAMGRNQDGTVKSKSDQIADRMTTNDMPVMFNWFNKPENEAVDPIGNRSKGFYDNFLDKIFGVTERNAQARKDRDMSLGDQYKLPQIEVSGLMPRTGLDKGFNSDTSSPLSRIADLSSQFKIMQDVMTSNGSAAAVMQGATNVQQTVSPSYNFEVTIAGSATEKDGQQFMDYVKTEVGRMESKLPGIAEDSIRGMLGYARSQQAER